MSNSTLFRKAFLIILIAIPILLGAQTDSLPTLFQLETVEVRALKIKKPWLRSATSVYQLAPTFKDQIPQNSLQEFLNDSPGIFSLNANNKAQDLRISIRGFGSRAAFGVRGVKLIVDGIPETTADGQGQLDNLNLGIIDQIEVLPGGASALYGNASGGVINISTTDEKKFETKKQFLEFGAGIQAFGGQQYQLTTGKKIKNTSLIFHTNHQKGDGYRDHAEFQSTNFNFRLIQEFSADHKLEFILNYMDSPVANDPGSVNLMAFDSLPRLARDRNVDFQAGEAIQQTKGSLRYETALSDQLKFSTYLFYSRRDFFGALPFSDGGIIELERNFFGGGSSLTSKKVFQKLKWTWQLGYELLGQRDNRSRFENNSSIQGSLIFSQKEKFNNGGFFFANDFNLKKWIFNTVVRYDLNKIKTADNFLSNGDDSGELNLNNFNYSLGVAYPVHPADTLFTNFSTSFETPTLNELSNNPDGSGFNPALKAQSAVHYELGAKGFLQNNSRYQITTFLINSKDELLPYELAASPGRNFFRNVGTTKRTGIELLFQHKIGPYIQASTNWSWQNFTFSNYEVDGERFDGNRLPGLPNFQGNIRLTFELIKDLKVDLQQQFWGKIYTNDANDEFQKSKSLTNLSVKYQLEKGKIMFLPYLGINNIFQTKYADNIRINAFGSRYYEAAPRAFLYGGLRVKF